MFNTFDKTDKWRDALGPERLMPVACVTNARQTSAMLRIVGRQLSWMG
jgi:hypothetical protein